ncbi:MAG: PLP-dependent transferase [Opitutales bacterium]
MTAFAPIPLGRPIPNSLHAVSCSLPTMRAVRGYEEKDPAITSQLSSGYPRFVVHPLLHQLARHCQAELGLAGRTVWLTSSAGMAEALAAELRHFAPNAAPTLTVFARDGIHGLAHRHQPELNTHAKAFLQNIGGFLSSRAAEDRLVQLGLRPAADREELFAGDALGEVRRHLHPLFAGTSPGDLLPATCGMNALYAAFCALNARQAARGRTIWVQLGWLYLDTIALLKRFTATPDDYVYLRDVFDWAAIEELFSRKGDRIAGLIIEAPTNPLIQTPDLAAIATLARTYGAAIIADPSVSSAFAVDVLPHADLVALSLTKYAGSEGDLTAGLVVVNPATPNAAAVRRDVVAHLEPVYPRDLARLAHQIGQTRDVLARVQASVPRIAAWLETQPAVKEVFWARHPVSRANYEMIARTPAAVGGMISFSLRLPLERFYDRLRLPKGPSFGMKTTLICPFMYLAHYDLVSNPAGRAQLEADGLDPELLRLAIGCEPADDIIAALAEALA